MIAAKAFPYEEKAEDLVSESFISLWKKWDDMQPESLDNIKQFLITTLRNKIRDEIRRQAVIDKHMDRVAEIFEPEELSYLEIKSDVLNYLLYEGIATLPKQCKQIIELTLQGKMPMEISAMMNSSIQTTWNMKCYALKKLRQYILPRLAAYA